MLCMFLKCANIQNNSKSNQKLFCLIHRLAQCVRLMMSLAIFLSYGLQFYVPINIIGPWFRDHFTGDLARQVSDAGLRIGLIVFTCEFIATQCVANTFPA